MRYLTLEDILKIHFGVINDYGGSHGVRDESRLQSVIQAPGQQIFGTDQYPSLYEKSAVYMRNIIGDHPFADGNKRSGITVGSLFLMRNGVTLTAQPEALEDLAIQIAVEHLSVDAIAAWLKAHSR